MQTQTVWAPEDKKNDNKNYKDYLDTTTVKKNTNMKEKKQNKNEKKTRHFRHKPFNNQNKKCKSAYKVSI